MAVRGDVPNCYGCYRAVEDTILAFSRASKGYSRALKAGAGFRQPCGFETSPRSEASFRKASMEYAMQITGKEILYHAHIGCVWLQNVGGAWREFCRA